MASETKRGCRSRLLAPKSSCCRSMSIKEVAAQEPEDEKAAAKSRVDTNPCCGGPDAPSSGNCCGRPLERVSTCGLRALDRCRHWKPTPRSRQAMASDCAPWPDHGGGPGGCPRCGLRPAGGGKGLYRVKKALDRRPHQPRPHHSDSGFLVGYPGVDRWKQPGLHDLYEV